MTVLQHLLTNKNQDFSSVVEYIIIIILLGVAQIRLLIHSPVAAAVEGLLISQGGGKNREADGKESGFVNVIILQTR